MFDDRSSIDKEWRLNNKQETIEMFVEFHHEMWRNPTSDLDKVQGFTKLKNASAG